MNRSSVLTIAIGLSLIFFQRTYAGDIPKAEKISPTIKLSYKITNGERSIRAAVSTIEEDKVVPVTNLIVNLYLTTQKKYDPNTGDGWVGNHVTDKNGHADFILPLKVSKLNEKSHVFHFIASIGSDPVFKDTREGITVNDASLELSTKKTGEGTVVFAELTTIQDSRVLPLPQKEIKLFVKREGEEIAFGGEQLMTDLNGSVSGILPENLMENGNITLLARYLDKENQGLVEVTQEIPGIKKLSEEKLNQGGFFSSLKSAPMPLVIVSAMVLIMLIFFFRVKKKT